MFKVPIDKIIPVTNARARIASVVNDVQKNKSVYVLTRGGRPAAILASIDYMNDVSKSTPKKFEPDKTEIAEFKNTEKATTVSNKDEESSEVAEDAQNSEDVTQEHQDDEQSVKISVN